MSRSCMAWLAWLTRRTSTSAPCASYFVVTASSAATVEASQMWESLKSMATRPGVFAVVELGVEVLGGGEEELNSPRTV